MNSNTIRYTQLLVALLVRLCLLSSSSLAALVGCASQPCLHGACREVQFDVGSIFSCHCLDGWKGERCDQPIGAMEDDAAVVASSSLRRNLKGGGSKSSKSKSSKASSGSKNSKSVSSKSSKCGGKGGKSSKSSKASKGCDSATEALEASSNSKKSKSVSSKSSKCGEKGSKSSKSSKSSKASKGCDSATEALESDMSISTEAWEEDDEEDDDEDNKDVMMYAAGQPNSEHPPVELKLKSGRRTDLQRDELRNCVHWAVGLEHESMLVHRHENSMEEFALDANKILRDMARYGLVHGLDKDQHAIAVKANDDGAEFSGRRCSGSIDLVFKSMMESVTTDARELSFDGAFEQLQLIDNTFLEMANTHPFIIKAQKDLGLGPVSRPKAGMSSQLGMYQRTGGNWFSMATCDNTVERELKDYTGSYHMSISLPSTSEGWVARDESILLDSNTCAREQQASKLRGHPANPVSWLFSPSEEAVALQQQEEWIEAHQNLANMVQWIEPLLVSVFGTADADSVCDAGVYTEGSFRSMETGWGVPGTTDVRTFKDGGIGRYIKNNFDWMFPDETVEFPSAYRENLSGCKSDGMGADIRTKTSVDEHHLPPSAPLPRMEVGQGIEIRIFDNFPIEHVPQVYRMLALVAEAGRHFTAPEYIYGNTDWTGAIQSVMREGWNAVLPEGYVRSMAAALNLPQSFADDLQYFQAFHVYSSLYETLWDAHSQGMWSILLMDDVPEELPHLEIPSRNSWEHGAINKGFTPNILMETLGLDSSGLARKVSITDIKLSDEACGEDQDDLVYLAETFGMASGIKLDSKGSIESFFLHQSTEWDQSYFTPPVCLSNVGAFA